MSHSDPTYQSIVTYILRRRILNILKVEKASFLWLSVGSLLASLCVYIQDHNQIQLIGQIVFCLLSTAVIWREQVYFHRNE